MMMKKMIMMMMIRSEFFGVMAREVKHLCSITGPVAGEVIAVVKN